MVQADYLFLMTDVDCLYTTNPRTHPNAQAIEVVSDISSIAADVSSSGSSLGTGGMSTKIVAARLATSAGVTTVITRSSKPGNVADIVKYVQQLKTLTVDSSGLSATPKQVSMHQADSAQLSKAEELYKAPLHTRFLPDPHPIRDRSFWILYGLAPHGTIFIDEGAHRALLDKAGLLPVGIVDVEGTFAQEEAVRIVVVRRLRVVTPSVPIPSLLTATDDSIIPKERIDHEVTSSNSYETVNPPPVEVGRALVNYSATEISRIKGLQSMEIRSVLGYADSEYVALRENISLVRKGGHASGKHTPAREDI